jgi:hypothetical protein
MNINIFLTFDILNILIKQLNIDDIINLILTNKKVYNIYTLNKIYINKIIIKKIFQYFKFNMKLITNMIQQISYKEISEISKIVFKKYNYFKRHMFCYKSDFIIFMLENNISSDILFDFYISACKFVSYVNDNSNIKIIRYNESNDIFNFDDLFENQTCMEEVISIYDMTYILEKSNLNQLKLLFEKFTIPITMLSDIIKQTLKTDMYKEKDKITLCIDYIFYRYCFKTINNNVKRIINYIVVYIVYYKQTSLLKYFLQKKNYYNHTNILDYQYLINKCIEYEDITHLKLLLKENKNESIDFKRFVIINDKIIMKLCKEGSFEYLKYIIDNLLGVYINSNLYIESICEGLKCMNLSINKDKVKDLKKIYEYFTPKNINIIELCLKNCL